MTMRLLEVNIANASGWKNGEHHRGTIDLCEIARIDGDMAEISGWEHHTWIEMRQGEGFFVHMDYEDVLELWRAAMCN